MNNKSYWLTVELPPELDDKLKALGRFGVQALDLMPMHISIIRNFTWHGREEDLIELIFQAEQHLPMTIVPNGVGFFQNQNRQHGYAGLDCPALTKVYRALNIGGGSRLRFYRPPQFRPHLTICRNIQEGQYKAMCREALSLLPESFQADTVTLLRNEGGTRGCWDVIKVITSMALAS